MGKKNPRSHVHSVVMMSLIGLESGIVPKSSSFLTLTILINTGQLFCRISN